MSWTFQASVGNPYTIKKNGYSINWNKTGIKSNSNMKISFIINIKKTNSNWRNVFLLTNSDDSSRLPSLYITPGGTGLYIRFATTKSWDDGYTSPSIGTNKNTSVTMEWNNNKFNMTVDSKVLIDLAFQSPITATNDKAILYIASNYFSHDDGITIQDFIIKDTSPVLDGKGIWVFPNSNNTWYNVTAGGYSTQWRNTGIRSNQNMTVYFNLIIQNNNSNWRNIFHLTNNANYGKPDDRIPAVWVYPNESKLHVRFSSSATHNDGIDSKIRIPLNQAVFIKLVWKHNFYIFYIDGEIQGSAYYNGNIPQMLANPDSFLFIGDPWHSSGGIQILNFTIKDDVINDSNYSLLNNSGKNNITCQGGTRTSVGKFTLNECSERCNQDKNCSAFDITELDPQNMKYTCNLSSGTNISPGGIVNNTFGCYKKINFDTQSCNYKLNDIEKRCYLDRYPDLVNANVNPQDHWSIYGCNENRNNQCPALLLTEGNYKFKGCFKANDDSSQKVIPNSRGKVNSYDECSKLAEKNEDSVFGISNNLNCFTGKDINTPQKNYVVDKNECKNEGGINTNNVYVRNILFVPKDTTPASLTTTNFSSLENFNNSEEIENLKDINNVEFIKYIIVLFIIILLLFLIYSSMKK